MLNFFKWLTYSLVILGALNWGFIGAFNFDLISFIFGDMSVISRIIYSIIGLCALGYLVLSLRNEDEYHNYNC